MSITRAALAITLGILTICWLFVLYEERGDRVYINVDRNTLFLSLTILLAGLGVTFGLVSRPRSTPSTLEADYLDFIAAIGDQSLTIEKLGKAIGKDYIYLPNNPPTEREGTKLDDLQHASLQRLVYEGKIYSLQRTLLSPKRAL